MQEIFCFIAKIALIKSWKKYDSWHPLYCKNSSCLCFLMTVRECHIFCIYAV